MLLYNIGYSEYNSLSISLKTGKRYKTMILIFQVGNKDNRKDSLIRVGKTYQTHKLSIHVF